ncbi:hypothetical protein K2B09_004627 [Salmonella enterica subsp. enterica]|nr:hypothetical protein [Salmonella enterica subsp. enterica]EHW9183293.1 hypothetical protein [Salmonella enterica subsp. enterica]EKS4618681.1 hypothetical protein [Salmonella enterica]EKS4946917.1 hypothetical protein [Salmonella enterica]
MNMIKYHIKRLAKVLGYTTILSLFFVRMAFSDELRIAFVGKAEYTGEKVDESNEIFFKACQSWHLNKNQVKRIFLLSIEYESDSSIINDYYWLPCEIKGVLFYNDIQWRFVINAASTAVWRSDNGSIYWGCNKRECNSMFLLPSDTDKMQ